MTLFFSPPTIDEAPLGLGRLHERYKLKKGITVVQLFDGSYEQGRYFENDFLLSCKNVWLGGHVYEVSPDQASDLGLHGYSSYLFDENGLPVILR